jgi:hypothetical protein
VIRLFVGRPLELPAQCDVAGGQGLRLIQGLRTDLADVIDAHEGAGQASFLFAHGRIRTRRDRLRPRRPRRGRDGSQGMVRRGQQAIDG